MTYPNERSHSAQMYPSESSNPLHDHMYHPSTHSRHTLPPVIDARTHPPLPALQNCSRAPSPQIAPSAAKPSMHAVASDEPVPESWDGWPDGDFSQLYSWDFANATNNLQVHWACSPMGGDTKGSDTAEMWQHGKRTGRKCCGSMECDNPDCDIVVRPQSRRAGREKQLAQPCPCGGRLRQLNCSVTSYLYSFEQGVYYINGGYHHHPRPTHLLHLLPGEKVRFEKIILENPTVKALALVVGRPGIHGPGKSIAEISPLLLNADRVKFERRRVQHSSRSGTQGGDDFVAKFSTFEEEFPGFVVFSQFGSVTVIIMQTRYMASKLLKDRIDSDAVNGIVSDAAHGYWLDPTTLLIISSVFGIELYRWIPGIMTYSNGASEEHYRLHFLALFQSIAAECARRDVPLSDELFANVNYISIHHSLVFADW
jgi:hypothetical protein